MLGRIFYRMLLVYCTLVAFFVVISGFLKAQSNAALITQAFFLPVALYFLFTSFKTIRGKSFDSEIGTTKLHIILALSIFTVLTAIAIANIYGFI